MRYEGGNVLSSVPMNNRVPLSLNYWDEYDDRKLGKMYADLCLIKLLSDRVVART